MVGGELTPATYPLLTTYVLLQHADAHVCVHTRVIHGSSSIHPSIHGQADKTYMNGHQAVVKLLHQTNRNQNSKEVDFTITSKLTVKECDSMGWRSGHLTALEEHDVTVTSEKAQKFLKTQADTQPSTPNS